MANPFGEFENFPARKLYDITPPITPALAAWPGDTPPSREVLLDMKRGDNITLSTLRSTVHLGAHADGPNHYATNAPGIGERRLDDYMGPCRVVRIPADRDSRITPAMLMQRLGPAPDKIAADSADWPPRILLATGTFPDPTNWNDDFAALDPSLVDFLHERGIRLIGIDTPSVDLFSSKDLPAHARFLAHDMSILEGLVLRDVPQGVYELIALPLKLIAFDASPVRAVLRTL